MRILLHLLVLNDSGLVLNRDDYDVCVCVCKDSGALSYFIIGVCVQSYCLPLLVFHFVSYLLFIFKECVFKLVVCHV